MIKKILSNFQNIILTRIYKFKPKFFFYSFYNYFESYAASPQITGLYFSKKTKVANKGDVIYLPNDTQITWHLVKYGELDYSISKIIKKKLNKNTKYTFIDIGANVGLVSRQLFLEHKNIEQYICIEPVSKTFKCLEKNTSGLKNINLYNFALGSKSETKKIFIDKSNHGNSSLEKTMMSLSKYSKYEVEKIKVLSVQSFFNSIKKSIKGKKLIIKIDTQSLDELIVSQLPNHVMKNVVLLNYELTSIKGIKKEKISESKFRKNISIFNKVWSEELGDVTEDWLVENLHPDRVKNNIETDIYLLK